LDIYKEKMVEQELPNLKRRIPELDALYKA
jgi:hypothetical protein